MHQSIKQLIDPLKSKFFETVWLDYIKRKHLVTVWLDYIFNTLTKYCSNIVFIQVSIQNTINLLKKLFDLNQLIV